MVAIPGYEVQELLSWGSQGDVFRGRDAAGERVAIKLVTADRTEGDPQAMERLRREARLLAALDSPHVVKVREFLTGPDWSCLVLEFLAGERLDKALRRRAGGAEIPAGDIATPSQATVVLPAAEPAEPPPSGRVAARARASAPVPAVMCTSDHVAWAREIVEQLASGLADMHRVRLIHRDIKPQNVMLVDGRVVLIDFGFARRDGVTTMTQAGTAIGTLAYMAPELLAGSDANEASDVYALGASAYQCLTGAPPFGSDATTIRAMASRGRPHDVRRRNAAVDASFAAVVARCLEPDPRDRYADAGQVLADLRRVGRGERVRAPFSPARTWRHHRRVLSAAVLVLGLVWILSAWLSSDRLQRVAEQIRRDVAAVRDAEAGEAWNQQAVGDRSTVVQHLNQLVATNDAEATRIAEVLGLAVLRFTARAHHELAVVPWQDDAAAPFVPQSTFVSAEAPTTLLVQPGRVWCFVRSTDRTHWWAPGDPRCLQLLLAVGLGDIGEEARRLDLLPTEPPRPPSFATARVPAGPQPVRDSDWGRVETDIKASFAVALSETSEADLWSFRRTMADRTANQQELDRWLRHPDETDEWTKKLWDSWSSPGDYVGSSQPAQITFWEAHRFAAWCGCRLPVFDEWRAAGFSPAMDLVTSEQRRVPNPFAEVGSESAWDVTDRRVRNANSNVREWALTRGPAPDLQFVALPGVEGLNPKGGPRLVLFSRRGVVAAGQAPDHLHGLRLYRTLLGEAAR